MDGISQKRSSSDIGASGPEDRKKRQRTSSAGTETQLSSTAVESTPSVVNKPTCEDLGRDGLTRSIALTLQHVGFDAASKEALMSFTETVETFLTGFVENLKHTAESSRRTQPTPADYETVLRQHNIPVSSLKPHLKNPVPKENLVPKFYNPFTEYLQSIQTTSSSQFLGPELDGIVDKESTPWIPDSLPSFPSKHTYRSTPVEVLVPDQGKKRLEAAADAKKAGQALRFIDRAHNASRHSELRQLAKRNPQSMRRHQALEELMKEYIPSTGRANGAMDIADHSMIVDAGTKYLRQEVPKSARRTNGACGVKSETVSRIST